MCYWGQSGEPAIECGNFYPFHRGIFLFAVIQYFPNWTFIKNPYCSACDSICLVSCCSGIKCIWFGLLWSLGVCFFSRSCYFEILSSRSSHAFALMFNSVVGTEKIKIRFYFVGYKSSVFDLLSDSLPTAWWSHFSLINIWWYKRMCLIVKFTGGNSVKCFKCRKGPEHHSEDNISPWK